MSMEQEWKELKRWVDTASIQGQREVYEKMTELERRSLPERVAKLLMNFNHDKYWQVVNASTDYTSQKMAEMVIEALRTGDTSELEKWQK